MRVLHRQIISRNNITQINPKNDTQQTQKSAHLPHQPTQSGATPSGSASGGIPAIEITKDAVASDAANYSDESEYIEGVPSQATAAAEAHRMLQRRKSSVAQQQILQQQQSHHQQQQQHQSGTVSTPQVSASQCDSLPIFYRNSKKKTHTCLHISLVEIIVPLFSSSYTIFYHIQQKKL